MRPEGQIEACVAAHGRLLAALDRWTDEEVGGPSLLPGWSRGHVITHLARNADSHVWRFEGAAAGEVRHQYPPTDSSEACLARGTNPSRAADIEAGAGRSADEVRDDLIASCARLEVAWRELPDDRWDREGIVAAGPRPMTELVFGRLREVEVHHVDLGFGYAPADWPPVYVEGELTRRLRGLPDRADHAVLVTWLLGRAAAPELSPW